MDPYAVAAEIARLLAPGGVAVIRTWEALLDDLPLATMVRDYRPVLESAGLTIARHDEVPDFRSKELPLYRALEERAEALRREIGDVAETLLEEARNMLAKAQEPPRVRKVFIVAKLTEPARLS